ncbi:MAG: Gldg family protein [Burkholderiales bacterium]|nr:Gldg family protein [Burkholderiales bacterium]
MPKKGLETFLYSAVGVLALALIVVAVNYIFSPVRARIDLTEGKVFTLSEGTRAILAKLESPVKIRFYYTQGEATPVALKTFAQRVEDLLSEFRSASGGKVVVEKYNPQPDSDAEDSATLDGIEGQMLNTGEKFYLGLAISQLDDKVAIPVLTPERERLLEYDLTRAVARVSTAKKPVVGVMSAVPVFGRGLSPLAMQEQKGLTEPWVLIAELKRDFELKEVSMNAESIDPEIRALLVIHPRDISEVTQYAIDQFLMRGGKLIAFVDPYMYFDQQRDMQNPLGGTQAGQSSLYALMKPWGFDMDMSKVLADLTYASGEGPRLLPTLLNLTGNALNPDDPVTSQVGSLLYAFGGALKGKPAEGISMSVLAKSSPNNMPVDLIIATLTGEPSTKGFEPTNTEQPLAIRLTGKFKSAFPDGKPKDPFAEMKKDQDKGKEAVEAKKPEPAAAPHLKESKEDTTVVLVGDADMLTDNAAVDIQDVFGQRVIVPRNGNLNFAQSLVEQLASDQNLIGLRSRAAFTRPLTVVRQMEQKAQEAYLGKIKQLEDDLQDTQKKLEDIQKRRGDTKDKGPVVLSPEQQAEVDEFRKRSAATRVELKELRRDLRQDTESLQFWTKVVNIGAMPLLIVVLGAGIALARRREVRP